MCKEHFLRKGVVTQGFEFNYVIFTKKKPLGIQIELICLAGSLVKHVSNDCTVFKLIQV